MSRAIQRRRWWSARRDCEAHTTTNGRRGRVRDPRREQRRGVGERPGGPCEIERGAQAAFGFERRIDLEPAQAGRLGFFGERCRRKESVPTEARLVHAPERAKRDTRGLKNV